MWIIVNGKQIDPVCVDGRSSYFDIVKAAGGNERTLMTVTYFHKRKGSDVVRSGTLSRGQTVKVEEGMRFDAVVTNQA